MQDFLWIYNTQYPLNSQILGKSNFRQWKVKWISTCFIKTTHGSTQKADFYVWLGGKYGGHMQGLMQHMQESVRPSRHQDEVAAHMKAMGRYMILKHQLIK